MTALLLGVAFGNLLRGVPIVLAYTAWVYWIFRGKASDEEHAY